MSTKNHPGIYVPPPLIYAAFFFFSFLLQKICPLSKKWLHTTQAHIIGWVLILFYFLMAFMAVRQFIISKNTVVTIKPATSLQTSGIYVFTRNPMYLSLVFFYNGLAVFLGNWWTFLLLPFLILVIQLYVIKKEEKYLQDAFGADYTAYKERVRRWI